MAPVHVVQALVHQLDALSDIEVTKGDVVECIEYINIQQWTWKEGSIGWTILESLKEFVRVNEVEDTRPLSEVIKEIVQQEAERDERVKVIYMTTVDNQKRFREALAEFSMRPTNYPSFKEFVKQWVENELK